MLNSGASVPCSSPTTFVWKNVIIRTGESAIKECSNIEAVDCRFEGNYPSGMYTVSKSTVAISMSEGVRHCGIPIT